MKSTVVAAIIGGVCTVCAAIITGVLTQQHSKQEVLAEINAEFSNITGNNNQITINDIGDFFEDYQYLKDQNQQLQQLNTQYYEQIQAKDKLLSDDSNQIEELQNQLAVSPIITYQNMELFISANKIPINTSNSVITIDGREYLSREIVDRLLPDREILTIKDGAIYVGPVISESANLFDQWVMQGYVDSVDTCTDSYGNQYTNVYRLQNNERVIFSLSGQYSQLRLSAAVQRGYDEDDGIITIKADDTIVYTSSLLSYKTEPFTEVSIPINNCSLLTIEHNVSGYHDDFCIISDAIVYN